jgi:hypothetical protein
VRSRRRIGSAAREIVKRCTVGNDCGSCRSRQRQTNSRAPDETRSDGAPVDCAVPDAVRAFSGSNERTASEWILHSECGREGVGFSVTTTGCERTAVTAREPIYSLLRRLRPFLRAVQIKSFVRPDGGTPDVSCAALCFQKRVVCRSDVQRRSGIGEERKMSATKWPAFQEQPNRASNHVRGRTTCGETANRYVHRRVTLAGKSFHHWR